MVTTTKAVCLEKTLLSQLFGRGHRAGGKGGGLLRGRGQGGRGEGKGTNVSETCGHLGGQGENENSPAVQSGRALPMGRCASPPDVCYQLGTGH